MHKNCTLGRLQFYGNRIYKIEIAENQSKLGQYESFFR